jgi:hypothetical protein
VVSSASPSASTASLARTPSGTPIALAGSPAGPARAAAARGVRARVRRGVHRAPIERLGAGAFSLRSQAVTRLGRTLPGSGSRLTSVSPTSPAPSSASFAGAGSVWPSATFGSRGRAVRTGSDLARHGGVGRLGLEGRPALVGFAAQRGSAIACVGGSLRRTFGCSRVATCIGALSTAAPSTAAA